MQRSTMLLVVALILLMIAAACNGDDGVGGTAVPTATETPEMTPAATLTPQITPTDAETPATVATETPEAGATATPSEREAQPAIIAPDQAGFVAQFGDAEIAQSTCDYNQDSGLADCGDKGLYQLEDPIQGGGAICWIMLIDDQPVGLNCKTDEPLQGIFYTIPSSPNSTQ